MTAAFSPRTAEVLRAAGWSPGRAIDTKPHEAALRAEGYPVHACVVDFLRSFGELVLLHGPQPHARIELDARLACAKWDAERIHEDWSTRAGSPLCAVGQAANGNLLLCMNSKGEVLGGIDETLVHVGVSGEDALEGLCTGRATRPVP